MSGLRTVVAAHIADLRLVSKKIRASEFAGSFHETAREFDKAADELQSALDAQPVAVAAVPDVDSLPFIIRGEDPPVIDWSAKGGAGCRPATEAEKAMWDMLSAAPGKPAAEPKADDARDAANCQHCGNPRKLFCSTCGDGQQQ